MSFLTYDTADDIITSLEIIEKLLFPETDFWRNNYLNKLDIWVPHKLNEIQLTKRISICDILLKLNETDPFLKRIITGDEKWVYDNVVRKRSWNKRDEPAQSASKANIYQKRVMPSVWWNFKGIVICIYLRYKSLKLSTRTPVGDVSYLIRHW